MTAVKLASPAVVFDPVSVGIQTATARTPPHESQRPGNMPSRLTDAVTSIVSARGDRVRLLACDMTGTSLHTVYAPLDADLIDNEYQ